MPFNATLTVLSRLGLLDMPHMPWLVPRERVPVTAPSTTPTAKVPNPPPVAPPGLQAKTDLLISWGKWGVMICGFAGLLYCCGQMAIGRKNRSALAADGATGIPWALGGLSLSAALAPIVEVFFA
ncbi:hypothetical protein [Actinomadura hibisca]|uniref:hypothetical protein n=1 Tax=Actinomadura hibisca TaxID=68565 RepID=UPI000A6CD36D|nr:hypothetical protein [Actinomadura hibisca]